MVYPIGDEKLYFHENLETGKAYFVKNVKKKEVEGVDNIFEATSETKLSLAKRAVENTIRYKLFSFKHNLVLI